MKNKGFTLIELMGVVIILLALVLMVFPSIINIIKKTSGEIDTATKALIIDATKSYIEEKKDSYVLKDGNVYCIQIQTLIDGDYLIDNLKTGANLNDFDTNRFVKVSVEDNKYKYTILDDSNCTEVEK